MTYEAWRISYQSSEQAARAAYAECARLRAKVKASEEDSAHHKALAESTLRVAKGWEDKCDELRAKIEQMEKQEPVAWCATDEMGTVVEALSMNQSRRFDTPLGFLPSAKGE